MAGRTPARYKRATAPLSEMARARVFGSGGSVAWSSAEYGSPELADLVDAFYDDDEEVAGETEAGASEQRWLSGGSRGHREVLEAALAKVRAESAADGVRRAVAAVLQGSAEAGAKQRVVSQLRGRGSDAGICKSQWDRCDHQLPAGEYEYIDLIADDQTRYIVEINLAKEFEVARPTTEYLAFLHLLPEVFVGRPDVLGDIVRLTCAAAKASMKSAGMDVPPWRRLEYMQAKWFSSYKRTTNTRTSSSVMITGHEPSSRAAVGGRTMGWQFICRMELARRERTENGQLAVAFKGV